MSADYANIPPEIRGLKAWLCWKNESFEGEATPRKVPYYASGQRRNGVQGEARDLASLGTMDEAVAAAKRLHMTGIGFAVLPQWGLTVLDFDKCVTVKGDIHEGVRSLVEGSYCELSPSGTGLHVFMRGSALADAKSRVREWGWGFEVFHSKGFVTVTGELPLFLKYIGPVGIGPISDGVVSLYKKRFGGHGAAGDGAGTGCHGAEGLTDFERLMFETEPLGLSMRALEELVRQLDPGCPQGEWLNVLAAVHHETGGHADGGELCADWSAGKWSVVGGAGKAPDNFKGRTDVIHRYSSFGTRKLEAHGRRPVTARWLVWAVNRKRDRQRVVLNAKDHTAIAARFTETHYMGESGPTILRSDGLWYVCDGGVYEALGAKTGDETVCGKIHMFLNGAMKFGGEKGDVPFMPGRTNVNEALAALKAAVVQNVNGATPSWLTGFDGPPAGEIINMTNGLLHVPSRVRCDHTSGFFTLNQVAYDWDANAKAPRWERFLREVWPDDAESADCLQEMMGYFLTQDTAMQKMFLIHGVKRTGKGTIGRVINALIGSRNMVSSSFIQMAGQFGLASFIGKQLAVFPDERNSRGAQGRVDIQTAVSRLLSITGEDHLGIERKHLPEWQGKLNTRVLIMSNEIPNPGDSSEVLASRFVFLKTAHSFFGREDPNLTDDLMGELSGIFIWALEGLDRLKARGRFIQPMSGNEVFEEMIMAGNPVRRFVDDCCEFDDTKTCDKGVLYDKYRQWCFDEKVAVWCREVFFKVLRSSFSEQIEEHKPRVNGDRVKVISGINIKTNSIDENYLNYV